MKKIGGWFRQNIRYVIACACLIAWSIYNIICTHTIPFLQTSLGNICIIFITGVLAYYISKNKDMQSKKTKITENFINTLLSELDGRLYNIADENDISYIRIAQRNIFRHIDLLLKILKSVNMSQEVEKIEFIKGRFQDYWDFISDHINDIDYLSKSKNILQNMISTIKNTLEEILVDLYIT